MNKIVITMSLPYRKHSICWAASSLNCVLSNPYGGRNQDCTLKDFRTALAKKGLIDDRLMTESLG